MSDTKKIARILFITYLAIVSLIGLVMTVVSTSQLIDAGLKTWVFPAADVPEWMENCNDPYDKRVIPVMDADAEEVDEAAELKACEERVAAQIEQHKVEKARDAVRNLALFIVGLPLFLVHFRWFSKERKSNE